MYIAPYQCIHLEPHILIGIRQGASIKVIEDDDEVQMRNQDTDEDSGV